MVTKGTPVWVVAWFPMEAGGALVYRALVAVMSKIVTGMTGLMIAGMSTWEGYLHVSSSPPGF